MLSVALGSTQLPVQSGVTQGLSGQVMKLNTHFYLVPRIRMSSSLPLLLPYAFMALTGRILAFYLLWVKVLQYEKIPPQLYRQESY